MTLITVKTEVVICTEITVNLNQGVRPLDFDKKWEGLDKEVSGMQHKVRVKDGAVIGGQAGDGARLKIMPKEYDVELAAEGILIFKGADDRDDSDLFITLGDYVELEDFPDIPPNKFLEII